MEATPVHESPGVAAPSPGAAKEIAPALDAVVVKNVAFSFSFSGMDLFFLEYLKYFFVKKPKMLFY